MSGKRRNSAVSANWHGSCKAYCIGGWPPGDLKGEYEMSGFSHYARHAMAAVAAVFISGALLVNILAVSAEQVHSVAGILA